MARLPLSGPPRRSAARSATWSGAIWTRSSNRQGTIEGGGESALEHHVQIVAVGPILLGAQLAGDHLVERRAGKRVRNRDADIVGPGIADQRDGLFDFGPGLAGVAELEEIAGPDVVAAQVVARLVDLPEARPFVHGVEHVTGLHAHPDLVATGAAQGTGRVEIGRATS